MADPKGLPFGRPPTQVPTQQFVDERRRSVTPDIQGWVSIGNIYAFDQTATPSDGALHINPIGPITSNILVDRCRIRVTTLALATTVYTGVYVRDFKRKTLTLVSGTKQAYDATSTGVKTGSLKTTIKLLAGGDYWLGLLPVGGAPVVSAIGSSTVAIMDRHIASGHAALPTSVNYADLARTQSLVPGVVYYHSNVI